MSMAVSDIDEMNHLSIELNFDTETDRFPSFPSASACPPLTSSFASHESSSADESSRDRRQSIADSEISVMLSSQGNSLRSSLSPMTPFSSDVLDMVMTSGPPMGCTSTELSMPGMFPYNDPISEDVNLHWMAQEIKQPPREHLTTFATPQHYSANQSHQDFGSPDQGLVAGASFESSLSRSIFHHRQHSDSLNADQMARWRPSIMSTPPRTVAPSATIQPILPSSPAYRIAPSTPIQAQSKDCLTPDFTSNFYSSSPIYTSPQQPVFVKNESTCHGVQPTLVRTVRESKGKVSSRNNRKSAERKANGGSGRSSKLAAGRSGIEYPYYIEKNSFACTAEDCVDKNGKRKKFKRQEHLKRHQKTCHTGYRPHFCWVPGCTTKPFSRTDNLNSHLLKTHGKNSPAARNRYIATLDPKSGVFDINYRGPFTDSGWPIRSK